MKGKLRGIKEVQRMKEPSQISESDYQIRMDSELLYSPGSQ